MKEIEKKLWPLGFLGLLGFIGLRAFFTHNPADLISFCFFFMSGFLIEKNRSLAYIGLFLGLIGLVLAMLGAKGLLAV
jgi:hypothetical protein